MGKRGPPPKPTHLKLIAGNPGKYPLNKHEPRARKAVPKCPAWLPEEAKTEWRWMVRELNAMGLLAAADRHALVVYCQTWARWRTAEDFIAKHGESYPIRDGDGKMKCFQPFPQVATARNLLTILKSYQQEFGMTPSARSRIRIQGDDAGESKKARRYFS